MDSQGIEATPDPPLVNWVTVHLSQNYLHSSFMSAARCAKLEIDGDSSDRIARLQHRSYVVWSVTSAAAFLEALANELFSSAGEFGSPVELDEETRRRFEAMWSVERFRLARVLEKFETALLLAGADAFDRGANPYQDAALLLQLRNALVHYVPKQGRIEGDTTEPMPQDDFARKLSGKFTENPWAASHLLITPGGVKSPEAVWPFFPERCLGSGCASWAARASLDFADSFSDRLGVNPGYRWVANNLPSLGAG